MQHRLSKTDRFLSHLGKALDTIFNTPEPSRARPIPTHPSSEPLNSDERHKVIGLMRVNHVGEICAQALYEGQALVAKKAQVQEQLLAAAQEEQDHLSWCKARLDDLGGRTSYLNPLWYIGAYSMGAAAGLLGDKISLGFLGETERQVGIHLENHLQKLPTADKESRIILEQMRIDELQHANSAYEQGGIELPLPVKLLMKSLSKIMTTVAYYV